MDILSILNPKSAVKDNVVYIPISSIKPNPYQPRRKFDKAGISELCESIKQYGVIQPISVRRIGIGSYELVMGERRLRACIQAKITRIPAIVVDMNDNDSAVVALIENLQRQNLTFMEEAQAYFYLISEHGLTQDELAQKVGKNQSTIANKLRLLKLPKQIKQIIEERGLTERHARALLKLPDEDLQMRILKKVCDNELNVKETDELVDKALEEILMTSKEKKTSKVAILKDVRIFTNTIKRAVHAMRNSGIDAESITNENDYFYEYVIKIPKRQAQ